MQSFTLMKLRSLASPTEVLLRYSAKELLVEEKFDGFKALIRKDQFNDIYLFTRRGIPFESNVPVIVNALNKLPSGVSLLGEIVYTENGRQLLSGVQSIVNASEEHALNFQLQNKGSLRLYVYDILEYQGKMINDLPLIKRKELLLKVVPISKTIRIVQSYKFSQYERVIKNSLKSGGEGIVIKPLYSTYRINIFDDTELYGDWYKYKPVDTEDVVLMSYFFHQKEKKAIFPAYQLKQGKLLEVGKLSGLDTQKQISFMKRIDAGEKIIVEVKFQEKFPSGKIRGMVFVRDRSREKRSFS